MPDSPLAPVEQLSFEKALKELEDIVSQLEQGKVDLERSIEIYERGEALKKRCEFLLKEAEGRVEKIRVAADGKAQGAQPLDEDDPF